MAELKMPRLDPVMEEGRIVEWLKREGEDVSKGETVLVVEGEKTTFEVESPYTGKLAKILKRAGEVAKVGEPIAIIEEAEIPAKVKPKLRIKASPVARRLARELGISLEEVEGTGPGGRITRDDVIKYAREHGIAVPEISPKVEAIEERVRRVPFAGVRKAIARRLSPGFHQALPVALTMEFDADKLLEHRKAKGRPSFTAYAVKAVALALKRHPEMNVTLEGDELIYHESVNIAVGVDTPKGLMAPVIKDADKKTLRELTELIDGFAERGRRGEITVAEQSGHSFTVTNLGALGVTYFTPIINPPDAAILALGTVKPQPYLTEEGEVRLKYIGHLTLVFDHRLVDGAPAARFLQTIKSFLENPEELEP